MMQLPLATSRKLSGGHDEIAAKLASTLYERILTPDVRVSSTRLAEMTRLPENIYRCVKTALVNELKLLSLRMDIDMWEVVDAASTKPFGFHAFDPGPGGEIDESMPGASIAVSR